LALLVIGAVVAVAEAHFPSHGIAGGVGVAAMAVGAVLALSGLGAGLVLGLLVGAMLATVGAGMLALSVTRGVAARRQRVRAGPEAIIGHVGVVRSWAETSGKVAVDGSLWQAKRSMSVDEDEDPALHAGDPVVVERLSGLTLSVRPAEEWELL
jgi:membrane-bound serine protease (ClpP class)